MRMPPKLFMKFFDWYCHPKLKSHIEGDLIETYNEQFPKGKVRADINFIVDVILLCRPGIIKPTQRKQNLNHFGMYKSFFKTGWRNLVADRGYSLINIGGLAIGMTVAMFIGLWVNDELSFNKYHKNYDRIAQIWNGGIDTNTSEYWGGYAAQYPIGSTLKASYPHFFKRVLMAWWVQNYSIANGTETFTRQGEFIDPEGLEMLSLKMLKGTYGSLDKLNSAVISQSMATAIFGDADPMNKTLRIDNGIDVEVTGVYEDIPLNNKFSEVDFFAPWELWKSANPWLKEYEGKNDWDNRMTNVYVELQPNVTFEEVNETLQDLFKNHVPADFYKIIAKNQMFAQAVPMSTWHLYSEFENGRPAGGRITFVWLFGVVGVFVLLLACINFVNLSTARSERRAREVGVRKAVGSGRRQLIVQFLSESFMVVSISFIASAFLLLMLLPWFNELAEKGIQLPFANPFFWMIVLAFILFTGLAAGVYPAFFLSSFQTVKVLKGSSGFGRAGSLPRKMLVIVQFSVSVILIIGTLIMHEQIGFARDRPVGYSRSGLVSMRLNDEAFEGKAYALRSELLRTGVVYDAATSSSPLTEIWNTTSGYTWPGRDPSFDAEFGDNRVSIDYGRTIGWEIVAGRDFSRDFGSDSIDAVIVNEAAVKYMRMTDPIGQPFTDLTELGAHKWTRTIVGVVKDIVARSPYEDVAPAFYVPNAREENMMHIRIDPKVSASEAMPKIIAAAESAAPDVALEYTFADEVYGQKFNQDERVGKLSSIFSVIAIFISCLGLFGLSSFIAQQRTKEIGIRKVMGASVSNLWQMLSKDFVLLVIIACVVAIPIGWYMMSSWLEKFQYRTEISWWTFVLTCLGAVAITLLTVSYQSIKAALMNPVKSLRSE